MIIVMKILRKKHFHRKYSMSSFSKKKISNITYKTYFKKYYLAFSLLLCILNKYRKVNTTCIYSLMNNYKATAQVTTIEVRKLNIASTKGSPSRSLPPSSFRETTDDLHFKTIIYCFLKS